METRKVLHSFEYFLVSSTMSPLPHWSCSIHWFGLLLPFLTGPGSVWPPNTSNQTHQENPTCYQLLRAALFQPRLECSVQTKVLKVRKVKGRCKTKQECAINVTAYSNTTDLVVLFHVWILKKAEEMLDGNIQLGRPLLQLYGDDVPSLRAYEAP